LVHEPEERVGAVDRDAPVALEREDAQVVGGARGDAVLVPHELVDPVRPPLEHHGASSHERQQQGRDLAVVVEEVLLGEPVTGKEHLRRVRELWRGAQ
jgi:hypothetical protein